MKTEGRESLLSSASSKSTRAQLRSWASWERIYTSWLNSKSRIAIHWTFIASLFYLKGKRHQIALSNKSLKMHPSDLGLRFAAIVAKTKASSFTPTTPQRTTWSLPKKCTASWASPICAVSSTCTPMKHSQTQAVSSTQTGVVGVPKSWMRRASRDARARKLTCRALLSTVCLILIRTLSWIPA